MAAEAAFLDDDRIQYLSRAKLIDLLGPDAAQKLVAAMGGAHFAVPAPDTVRCGALAATIGADAAVKFCREYGETRVIMPRFLRSLLVQRILDMTRAGMSARQIAVALHCSERRVFQVRASRGE